MKAEVITRWGVYSDAETGISSNRPQLVMDYVIPKWADVTGQPAANLAPDPNMYIIQIECDEATLDAIEADANYVVGWLE